MPEHPIEDQGLRIKRTQGTGNEVQGNWEVSTLTDGEATPEQVFQEILKKTLMTNKKMFQTDFVIPPPAYLRSVYLYLCT